MVKTSFKLALALAALSALAACRRPAGHTEAAAAGPPEAPALWTIEVLQDGAPVSRVDICADAAVRASFTRPAPSVGGKPCVRTKDPVSRDGTWLSRCAIDGAVYRVSAVTAGDTSKDFTVDTTVVRYDRPVYGQVRRYRLVGACPAAWHVGDSAAPGDKELLDTLSGQRRPRP